MLSACVLAENNSETQCCCFEITQIRNFLTWSVTYPACWKRAFLTYNLLNSVILYFNSKLMSASSEKHNPLLNAYYDHLKFKQILFSIRILRFRMSHSLIYYFKFFLTFVSLETTLSCLKMYCSYSN